MSALKNVHILEADVTNYASLEVCVAVTMRGEGRSISSYSQRAAKQTASVTGGSLDYLIHNAARTDGTIMHDFDSL